MTNPYRVEQHRVEWNDRANYLSALRDLRRAVDREMDMAQVGADCSGTKLLPAIAAVQEAGEGYGCQVSAAKDRDQAALQPDLQPTPHPRPRPRPRVKPKHS